MTPLGDLLASVPPCDGCDTGTCEDHPTQPGDAEAGRGLLRVWSGQIAARCADPTALFRNINPH